MRTIAIILALAAAAFCRTASAQQAEVPRLQVQLPLQGAGPHISGLQIQLPLKATGPRVSDLIVLVVLMPPKPPNTNYRNGITQ